MACTDNGHESPGYLRLDYTHTTQSIAHSTRARLVFGVDPLNVAVMTNEAIDWAAVWAALVTNAFVCGGFSVLRHDGSLLWQASFFTPQLGTHPAAAGALDYASRTLAFTGRGKPDNVGVCAGEEVGRIFVGAAYEFIPRQKYMVFGADAGPDAYMLFLNDSTNIWADAFGQKAGVRSRFPIQFNAYGQGRNGT